MHRAFVYSSEDVQMVIESMAARKGAYFLHGDDIPLVVMSQKPHMLYDYFKQRFAQVCFMDISDNLQGSFIHLLTLVLIKLLIP